MEQYLACSRRADADGRYLMMTLPLLSASAHGVYPVPNALDNRRISGECPGAISEDVKIDQFCPD
jgi:hypothetical protein